ncbi:MAG: glycosyltransferase family 4 protein [Candidatus Omnitrophica bacterium]|nr:glycosyltransferase family 4 protein [Candidatus Omnitrophota bacterium]
MKIVHLTNHLNIGGITSYLLGLSVGLKNSGHTVYIASGGGEMLSRFLEAGIIHITLPLRTKKEIGLKVLYSALKLKEEVRKRGIEVIHSHSRTTQVTGYLVSRLTGAHYLSTCHGFFKPRILRRIFPCWGERVIAISQQVREHLVSDFQINEEIIAVIPNGIDIERLQELSAEEKNREEARTRFGLTGNPVIGIIARLSDVKGHSYLISAMKKVLEKYPQAQLFIVGDGKEKARLVRLAAELKIEDNVVFLSNVVDTREALSAIDLFVMPSLKEGLGLAVLEAMAAAKAVIVSNTGGLKSLINDGVTGLLVEPQDTEGLASAISGLVADESRRRLLGKAAQEFVSKNFSQEKMVRETERMYFECVKPKS